MNASELRLKGYQKFLEWIMSNLSVFEARPVDRDLLSTQTGAQPWMVSRGLLMLEKRAYVLKGSGAPAQYLLGQAIGDVTPEQLNEWVTNYNLDAIERSNQKKREREQQIKELTPTDSTPLERATENFTNAMQAYKFGFYGPNGWQWYKDVDEATEQAGCAAMEAGVQHLFVVQKLREINIQPQVTLFQ